MSIAARIIDQIGFIINILPNQKKLPDKFPDFLGIGAQKSGTTWLYANLKKHPEIYLPRKKEIHYFDWYFYKGINWYYNHFNHKRKTQKTGEITPGYSILNEKKIKYIKSLKPDLKIILLLRNPIDRAWSHAVMNLSTIPDIEINKISDQEFISHFNHPRSIERGNYLKIISKWKKYFPENQLYIGNYSLISQNPEKLLNQIFKFLNIKQISHWKDFPIYKEILPINRNKSKREIPPKLKKYLSEIYKKDINALNKINIRFLSNN